MLEHFDNLVEASAKAISNIKFDKVVVWEGGGQNGTQHHGQLAAQHGPHPAADDAGDEGHRRRGTARNPGQVRQRRHARHGDSGGDLVHRRKISPEDAVLARHRLAWTSPYEGTDFHAAAYAKQWSNPRPDVEIRSLDMLPDNSPRGTAAPLAITAARAE